MSDVLYEDVIEVHERVVLSRDDCQLSRTTRNNNDVKTTTGDKVIDPYETFVLSYENRLKYGNVSTKINYVVI
jgi:hypothetical protein